MEFQDGLLYTISDEWVKQEVDKVTIGVSDYAQSKLGYLSYVELPEVGWEFKKWERIAVLSVLKTATDIYAPVSGKVVETNLALRDHPKFINEDPFGKGWIVKMAIQDKEELKKLISAEDYKKLVLSRLAETSKIAD